MQKKGKDPLPFPVKKIYPICIYFLGGCYDRYACFGARVVFGKAVGGPCGGTWPSDLRGLQREDAAFCGDFALQDAADDDDHQEEAQEGTAEGGQQNGERHALFKFRAGADRMDHARRDDAEAHHDARHDARQKHRGDRDGAACHGVDDHDVRRGDDESCRGGGRGQGRREVPVIAFLDHFRVDPRKIFLK